MVPMSMPVPTPLPAEWCALPYNQIGLTLQLPPKHWRAGKTLFKALPMIQAMFMQEQILYQEELLELINPTGAQVLLTPLQLVISMVWRTTIIMSILHIFLLQQ